MGMVFTAAHHFMERPKTHLQRPGANVIPNPRGFCEVRDPLFSYRKNFAACYFGYGLPDKIANAR